MGKRAEHESTWVSAHVFYQDDLDRLLTHVVAPLVDELSAADLAQEFFFLRYWDGGPHLRLRVLPTVAAGRAELEHLVKHRFGDYLTRYPSADRISAAEYGRLARMLAQVEGVAYAECCYPNNSVVLIPYRREHHRYGRGSAMQAVERHFAESSRIALRVVTMGTSTPQRTAAAAAVLLLTWFIASGPDAPPRPWPGWGTTGAGDVGMASQLAQVIDLARRMRALAGQVAASAARGTLIDWARSMAALRSALPTEGRSRVLDICAHLICNRFGVPMAAESALRGLVAGALAELATEGS